MKKYSICFFLLFWLCFVTLSISYPRSGSTKETEILQSETTTMEAFVLEETVGASITVPEETSEPETQAVMETESPVYLILAGENEILVYYPDEATLFKRIPIIPTDLSEPDQKLLEEGITVESLDELYHYLETITS